MKTFLRALVALFFLAAAVPAGAQIVHQRITNVGGSGTAYTGSVVNATSYGALNGAVLAFTPNTGGTGAATLTINGFGGSPPSIVKPTGSGLSPLALGDLVAGQTVLLYYDLTTNQFRITSPPPSGAAAALPQGYLTPCQVTNGSPVTGCTAGQLLPSGDVTSATALYYEPAFGSTIPIYNGSAFINFQFAELTLTIPSSRLANTLYDVFVFSNAGVVTPCFGPAWTTSTAGSGARGTGAGTTQITQVNGIWVNTVSASCVNGASTFTVSASQGTYVATCLIDATNGQVTFNVTFGQSRKWACWNAYNRQPITLKAGDSTANWSYTSTVTWRPSHALTANSLTSLNGLPLEPPQVQFNENGLVGASGGQAGGCNFGIGVNSTSSPSGTNATVAVLSIPVYTGGGTLTIDVGNIGTAIYQSPPVIGSNVYTSLEIATAANGCEAFGTESLMSLVAKWRG